MAQPTTVLFSSGIVAAGAEIITPVLDLRGTNGIGIVVDNTAGAVFRDLNLLSYLDDGTTLIETLLLRKVGFGAAPAGSVYAPGSVRGYIGPNPPGGTTGVHILYDNVSAANTAIDTGALWTEDLESVVFAMQTSAGTSAITTYLTLDDGAHQQWSASAAVGQFNGGIGEGVGVAGSASGDVSFRPSRRARFTASPAGIGNTVRVVIIGRGRVPGTFAHQIGLPTKAKFQLVAAGAANARVTIFGY